MMFTINSRFSHFKKKNFMASFYGWGSTASSLEPLWGGSLLFTTKSPEIPGTHFIDLGRMKGWVDLGATEWFWTWDPWIGNPAPMRFFFHLMCLDLWFRLFVFVICHLCYMYLISNISTHYNNIITQ